MNSGLLTVGEVAELLRVSERAIWKWSASGQIPRPAKIGRAARWRASDLSAFVANGCRMDGCTSETAARQ